MLSRKKLKAALFLNVLLQLKKLHEEELIKLRVDMKKKPKEESHLKLVIENPRTLPEEAIVNFEYVDIKHEPNPFIPIRREASVETTPSNASTIDITVPLLNIKSEPECDSSSQNPSASNCPSPPSVNRKMIETTSDASPVKCYRGTRNNKPQMIDQACQTSDILALRNDVDENPIGKISIEALKLQPKKFRYLTGFESFTSFDTIYKDVEMHLPFGCKKTKYEIFFMTWMKLKLDLPLNYLSILMNINPATITRLFYDTFDILHRQLTDYIVWPNSMENREKSPIAFKKIFGNRSFFIIDCFEVFSERTGNINNFPAKRNVSLQERKLPTDKLQTNSKKYLMCFSTSGSIIYISKPFDATFSKHDIAIKSGFLDMLATDDIILADREFVLNMVRTTPKAKSKTLVPLVKSENGKLEFIKIQQHEEFIKIKQEVVKSILVLKQRILALTNRPQLLAITNKYGEEIYSDFIIKMACTIVNLTPPHEFDDHLCGHEKEEIEDY